MSIKIVHAGDFHIGVSLSHLGTNLAKMRADEIRQSLVRVSDFCRENAVDALILTGDIFDGHKPTKADSEFVRNTLSSLSPLNVYIICGNHDYMCPDSPFAKENYFSENVHIFPCYESSFELPGKDVVFWGKSYSEGSIAPSFDECVFDESKINIMLLHGDTVEGSSFNIISKETLSAMPVNYAAFGHIHAGEIFNTGNVKCAYSGTPEGHSFKDNGVTGIILAEISNEETILRQIDFSLRKYRSLSFDITGKTEQEIIDGIKALSNSDDFFSFTLTGEYSENSAPDTAYIRESLSKGLHYIEINDDSFPGYDLDMIEKEESLRGAFLRELRETVNSEEEFARAAKIGLDALGGRNPDLGGAL